MFSESGMSVANSNRAKINYLKRFSLLDKEIDRKVEELAYWRGRLGQITSIATASPKGGGSIYKSGDIVAKIVDLEQELNREIDQLVEFKRTIESLIKTIEDETERLLLYYRYIDGLSWEEIAVKLSYTYRHTTRMHGWAISKIKMS